MGRKHAMKIHRSVCFLVFVWAATAFGQGTVNVVSDRDRVTPDYYAFLIDVSGSMAGKEGHPVIFPRVIEEASRFIRSLPAGTTVYVVPFAESVRDTREFVILKLGGGDDAIAYLN